MNNKKYVWVEIELNKIFNKITLFRGKILKKDLKKWRKGKLDKNSIKLENTYWCDFTKEKLKIYYIIPGKIQCDEIFNNFTGTFYLLTKNIISIATLKNGNEYFSEIERINYNCNINIQAKKIIL